MNPQLVAKKRKTKPLIKKLLGQIHLWLGLIAGIVITISMIGAAIFVWEDELTDWWHQDLVFVKEVKTEALPLSQLFEVIKTTFPNQSFTSLRLENDVRRTYKFRTFKRAEKPGWSWWSTIEHWDQVYVDPYKGTVLGVVDKKRDWITMSRFLHQNLLLNGKIGQEIIGAAALIMIILALSGLYLWFPKNKKALKQRFQIKWKAKFKRVNWDIHSVGGFYTHLFVLFFAATGLVWSYKWWSNSIYRLLGNDPKEVFARQDPPTLSGADQSQAIDIAFADALKRRPSWWRMSFNTPRPDKEKGAISAFIRFKDAKSGWDTSDQYYYHPETGANTWSRIHEKKLLGEKWRNSNYAMHVGSIYGLPTKIIAFICALFFASLPITGFLIWWGKMRKKKKKPKRKSTYSFTRAEQEIVA